MGSVQRCCSHNHHHQVETLRSTTGFEEANIIFEFE
jgi:hypothetical protein